MLFMTTEELLQHLGTLQESLFGTPNQLLYALVCAVAIDYATGICVAVHQKKLSSKIGSKGIANKVGIFLVVSLSHILDFFVLESADTLRALTVLFYLSNECISILENVSTMGLPLPQKLKEILTHLSEYTKD